RAVERNGNRLARKPRAVFTHRPRDGRIGPRLRPFPLAELLSRGEVLASLWVVQPAIGRVPPVLQVDDRHERRTLRVGKNRVLNVLCAAQADEHVLARLLLPFRDGVEPELDKVTRTCELLTDLEDHVAAIAERVEAVADVAAVEVTADRVRHV